MEKIVKDNYEVYSNCVTATCRSLRIMFGMIPKITATSNNGNINMNSRRETSVVNDRYCEYEPYAIRLNRQILYAAESTIPEAPNNPAIGDRWNVPDSDINSPIQFRDSGTAMLNAVVIKNNAANTGM